MKAAHRNGLWIAAVVSFLTGLVFILSESAAGWFFVVMGIIYLGLSSPHGQALAQSRPRLVRWGAIIATTLLILLLVIMGIILILCTPIN